MSLSFTIDAFSLIMSILSMIVIIMVIFRTRKGLDRAFKMYLVSAITLVAAGAMDVNTHLGLIPIQYAGIIFVVSRLVAASFFFIGTMIMLAIINKESR